MHLEKCMATGQELRGLRILLIDVNQDAAESLAWLFADAGAEVRAANDALNIEDLVREFDPGMVVLDLALPTIATAWKRVAESARSRAPLRTLQR